MRPKPLVLLVDDEDDFLEIASVKLQARGFDTVTTQDPHEALRKAESLQPDFVLSDIYMVPGPNGWDFIRELHQNPKTRNIKFAFFTSLRDPWLELKHDQAQILAELGGPPVFLSKLDDVDKLADRVMQMLQPA
jgi:CheY-like chemotaxis protein